MKIYSKVCPWCNTSLSLGESGTLLAPVYAIVAIITVISFGYTEYFANWLGIEGSGVLLGFTLIPLGSLLLLYVVGFIAAWSKA